MLKRVAIPLFVLCVLAFLFFPFFQVHSKQDLDLMSLGQWPVLHGGRVKPLDSVGRAVLLTLRGKQTVRMNSLIVHSDQWFLDVLTKPALADTYPVFRIDNPSIVALIGADPSLNQKYYSFHQLQPALETVQSQATDIEKIEPKKQTAFQKDVIGLRNKLWLYFQLKNAIQVESISDFDAVVKGYQAHVKDWMANPSTMPQEGVVAFKVFKWMSDISAIRVVPRGSEKSVNWLSMGDGLMVFQSSSNEVISSYQTMASQYQHANLKLFNKTVKHQLDSFLKFYPQVMFKVKMEYRLNQWAPFYRSLGVYLVVFLLVFSYWLWGAEILSKMAYLGLWMGFSVHTIGILTRMYVQGRPPVTNLYTSAVFVGWIAVLMGLMLEKIYKNNMGTMVASVMGFLTLIIAHHLSLQGDTLEMMQAVLDSNFWLSTHVVTVTIGYGAAFLAGVLANIYVLRGTFTSSLDETTRKNLHNMVYGVLCFALFFSFTGTVLGGIWADQSWGRFWGWDPKENGALLIVLWNAAILHARLGGMIKTRGLMAMAILGNIVTSFSWFGVNMLGVGLHSYGFMDKALFWLVVFVFSQLFMLWLCFLPSYKTHSQKSL